MSSTEQLLKHPNLWRAGQLGNAPQQPGIATGYTQLDAHLPGGGWPEGGLMELLLASAGLSLRTVVSERNYPPAKPPSLPWRWLRRLTPASLRLLFPFVGAQGAERQPPLFRSIRRFSRF